MIAKAERDLPFPIYPCPICVVVQMHLGRNDSLCIRQAHPIHDKLKLVGLVQLHHVHRNDMVQRLDMHPIHTQALWIGRGGVPRQERPEPVIVAVVPQVVHERPGGDAARTARVRVRQPEIRVQARAELRLLVGVGRGGGDDVRVVEDVRAAGDGADPDEVHRHFVEVVRLVHRGHVFHEVEQRPAHAV